MRRLIHVLMLARLMTGLTVTLLISTTAAAEHVILPAAIRLDGPRSHQKVLVEARDGAYWIGDRTKTAVFSSDNPAVAVVSAEGTVIPKGNGTATITAKLGAEMARVSVSVENFDQETQWSFRNHVEPILTKASCNSGACHGAAAGKNGLRLSLRGYAPEVDYDVLTRQALGRRIVPSAPAESLFLLKPTGALEHGGGVKFTEDSLEYRVISEWISAGMQAPTEKDLKITGLRVFPESARLKPGLNQRILVQAIFENGHVEDVTDWAKFATSDESTAKVDDAGNVRVDGHGEASILVGYAGLVARTTITSPFGTALDPQVFRKSPRLNPIDEKNLSKLESLGITPSPDAGDAAFLRRAYLDATGTLPPFDETERFLADRDLAKRRKLIDRLLESPEYVDYWAYKWSDLLLVSSNKLPAPAMWAFYRHVRQSVAKNVSWDAFARSIVTARGSALKNGAANYFVLHRDPIDLTESASMAFLGLSLTCARCHNHPMEKWTQNQYYGMASLFSRVQLKDGSTPGDVIVMPAVEGDIRHPRTGTVMAPEPLDSTRISIEARGDRRAVFADWLAQPSNPYFAKAIVNRVWANFFGRGLIDPEDDLRATNPPSDEPLMNWLVADFRDHHMDVKHLIRTIMRSAVYARSSLPSAPGNASASRFLSHYPVKRLPAEVLLDAIAQVTDVPTAFPGFPAGWRSLQLPDSKVESTFLTSFGRPERLNTCSCERSSEPSMSQALHLANGATINEKLRNPKGAVAKALEAKASDDAIIERLFVAALCRRPTENERSRLRKILSDSVAGMADPKAKVEAHRQAVEDLYWATLTGNEFLFNH